MNLKSIAGFAVGPFLSAALGLISVPVIAWIFPAEDVGRLNVLQVTLSLCMMLVLLGMDQAYVREYHTTKHKSNLFRACLYPGLLATSLLILSASLFSAEIALWLYGVSDPVLYFYTAAALLINYLSRFLSLILRMQERGLAFSLSQSIPKAVQLGLVLFVLVLPIYKNTRLLFLITVASLATVLICYGWTTRHQWFSTNDNHTEDVNLKKLFLYGLPLVPTGFAFIGINAVSTYSLRTYSTLSELAIYSVAMSFAGAAGIFQSIFSVIWTPLAFKWEAEGADMRKVEKVANVVLAIICLLAIIFGSMAWVLDYILPAEYARIKYILLCGMIQPLLYSLSIVTSLGIGIKRKSNHAILSSGIALLINIILNYFLTHRYGATGALIGNAVSFLVLFFINTEISSYFWKKMPRLRMYIATSSITTASIYQATYNVKWFFHPELLWIIISVILIFFFKKEYLFIFNALRNSVYKYPGFIK